jgi:predicted DNA-binding transcriptional regulator YafY
VRRADRLFQLVQILRRGRVRTARQLAERLEVSERTVYRDVADLLASGVPIEGEAGVGYRLRNFDLPPLAFTRDELEALVLGTRIVESWTDPELRGAARRVLAKVEAVLQGEHPEWLRATPLFAPPDHWVGERVDDRLISLRRALREQRKVRFSYLDLAGKPSERTVRPLSLAFYGPVWVFAGWCEMREGFRAFRVDRMADLVVLEEGFVPEPGKRLEDFLASM